ncbi:hypothetical protein [Methanosphaera sp. WGK6]|uniref:hypothetical protein n=1 Tax=Methanosphaera sp. WGK6 TaxID=1561964 RepID=UPI000A03FC2F|nr:hypothetical protein [Methanosphaera sp. WGK6]
MTVEIKVTDIIPRILSADVAAEELFREINKLNDNEVILDFIGIEFMSISFAQEYSYQKRVSKKIITEKNLLDSDKELLSLSKNLFDS